MFVWKEKRSDKGFVIEPYIPFADHRKCNLQLGPDVIHWLNTGWCLDFGYIAT